MATACAGVGNGTITVDATTGTPPYTYRLDGNPPQTGANPYTFINVNPGVHTIYVTDNNGCNDTSTITVATGPPLAAATISNPTTCSGASNGSMTSTPINGQPPYAFRIDGA